MRVFFITPLVLFVACAPAQPERSDIASAVVGTAQPQAVSQAPAGSLCAIPADICAEILETRYPYSNRPPEQDAAADAQFGRLLTAVTEASQNCAEPTNMNYLNIRHARSQSFRNSFGQQLNLAIVGNTTCYTGGPGGVFVNG